MSQHNDHLQTYEIILHSPQQDSKSLPLWLSENYRFWIFKNT